MQATRQMIRTMTAENSIEVETVAPTVPTWTEEEETEFQTAYTTALSVLSARLGARDIELSEATISRMKNPKLLAELRDFRRNPKKVILWLVRPGDCGGRIPRSTKWRLLVPSSLNGVRRTS